MEQLCLECGEKVSGRIDKKFCDDQCRNTYNNRQNRDGNNYIRNVNNILRKNRRVLAELVDKGRATKDELLLKGLNFNYYTNTYTTKDNRTYYYCYDYAYLELEGDWYAIVKRKEWV